MAAEIRLHVFTGTDAATDGGSAAAFSFLSADSAENDQATRVAYPISVPSSGCSYSYEKWISGCVSIAPNNKVGNFQVWGTPPGQAFPTGTCWLVGTAPWGSGSAPTGTSFIATSSLALSRLAALTTAACARLFATILPFLPAYVALSTLSSTVAAAAAVLSRSSVARSIYAALVGATSRFTVLSAALAVAAAALLCALAIFGKPVRAFSRPRSLFAASRSLSPVARPRPLEVSA